MPKMDQLQTPSDTEVRISKIYHLRKVELVQLLEGLQLDSEGTVEELRARLVGYYRAKETTTPVSMDLMERAENTEAENTGPIRKPTSDLNQHILPLEIKPKVVSNATNRDGEQRRERDTPSAADICDKVRKWGVKFDGSGDPLAFTERIEELRECYGYSGRELLLALPELLKGRALLWYRNNRSTWKNWEDVLDSFKLYFIPHRHQYTLEEEIRSRVQKGRESATEYVTDILTLMRRHGEMSQRSQMNRIYENRSY
uniref:Retrotransposon gag domain-containing protein n=1 Tax=Photinus pyralis TaxID=7054 RepID=A0A1Y1LPB7_PHOPY